MDVLYIYYILLTVILSAYTNGKFTHLTIILSPTMYSQESWNFINGRLLLSTYLHYQSIYIFYVFMICIVKIWG